MSETWIKIDPILFSSLLPSCVFIGSNLIIQTFHGYTLLVVIKIAVGLYPSEFWFFLATGPILDSSYSPVSVAIAGIPYGLVLD
jgi:hypothetical protein